MAAPASEPLPTERQVCYDHLFANPRFHLALVTLLAITLMFSQLADNGLPNYDDCYYAQKAKEILQTGDWITLHYNGEPRSDNPPLYMWFVAFSYKIFGISEYAARFPSALLGVATVVLVYFFARWLFGFWAGFFSAFVLTTTLLFVRYARRAMVDTTLSFFVCLALFALVLALQKDRRYFLLWGASISLAILTKSVLGLFPLVITVIYLLTAKRIKLFLNPYFLLGLLTILLLGGSWYLHQYLTLGQQFIHVHFRWLILQRAFFLKPEPWYAQLSYFKQLAFHYWPWLPLLVFGMARWARRAGRKDENTYLLVLWVGTILLALSLQQSRIGWYMLPIFPAAAIICGATLQELLREQGKLIFTKTCGVLAIVAFLAINATPLQLSPPRETDVRVLAPYVKHFASRGARVTAFRQVPHRLNNVLLFYSDRAAFPIYEGYPELAQALGEPALVLCIVDRSDLETVVESVPGIYVLRKTDRLALISNQPLDTTDVRIW